MKRLPLLLVFVLATAPLASAQPSTHFSISPNTEFEVGQSAESLQAMVIPVAITVPIAVGGLAWLLLWKERRRIAGLTAGA